MKIDLNGKRALVCGSTQGIGYASAKTLAEAGASVTLLARNEQKLIQAKGMLVTAHQSHQYVVADFAKPDELKEKVDSEIKKNGGFDILINNTGGPKAGPVLLAQNEEFTDAFRNHLLCNHLLVQSCIEHMKANNFGRIINIISTSVKQPLRGLGVSNTIRAAVANWAKTLSVELAPFGITVNNVLPGATATQRLQEIIKNKSVKTGIDEELVSKEMLHEIPAGRFAQPDEIANAVVFLASLEASYINGINLPVDGGRTSCL